MREFLPHGQTLPADSWRARHRGMLVLLWAHAAGLPVVGLAHGFGVWHSLLEGGVVALFGLLAVLAPGGRRLQSLIVALGLLTASAVLVHLTGGLIEAHFHFFVMVGVISLYEDWTPFLVAVAYVLLQHGVFATLVDHDAVFNHGGPAWKYAAIHSLAVGALGGALIIGWRASERQRAALVRAERRQRVMLDALGEGVILIDRDGTVLAANPSARRLLPDGLVDGPGEETFEPRWIMVRPDGGAIPANERATLIAARTGEPVYNVEAGLRRPDGSVLWLRGSAVPLPEGPEDPGPYPVVISFEDVTARRAARDALERSNAELRQFAYVASHDLSEPLRMVTSYLQLLRRRYGDGRLGSDADEFIGHAVDGAMRMRALIEDLLSYSRAGGTGEPQPVDCEAVAEAVLADLQAAVRDADAQVEIADLPVVAGDPLQIRQVFQNLIANALKFRRGPGVRVWVRAQRCGDEWEFSVADDGIGIPLEHRERVFDMFQRLHHRDAYEGTGIGLAICRKIVEHHGGAIRVEAREGGGTVFRFTLPARPRMEADVARAMAAVR